MTVAPTKYTPHHPEMIRKLADDELLFCNKVLSSEALVFIIIDRIVRRVPTSVVRMADGEKALLDVGAGLPVTQAARFLREPAWLRKYGLFDADLVRVGRDLLWAGLHADFLAPAISGLYSAKYRVHPYFATRPQFIDQFYHRQWWDRGRVAAVLQAGPVIVLTREHEQVVQTLREVYNLNAITGCRLSSWEDQAAAALAVRKSVAHTVLVTGGPSGKRFVVELAEQTGRVVLDVGGALEKVWCRR